MCGIFGFNWSDSVLVRKCTRIMEHRGPDDEGYYVDEHVSLGMRRLAIIDLKGGKQPMCNEDGTIWIIFNGEIYNYKEIREKLANHRFKTESDTEVIIHAYEEWGENFVKKLNGMFAIALWDLQNKKLLLIRDRVGVKPLYYYWNGKQVVFSSELRPLLALDFIDRTIDKQSLWEYLTLRYVLQPKTLLKSIKKIQAGSILILENKNIKIKQYWDKKFEKDSSTNFQKVTSELSELITDSVKKRIISDVDVGVFLSGGVDSSGIAYLYSKYYDRTLKTFTIGFEDENISEIKKASRTAGEIGSSHYEKIVDNSFLKELNKIVISLDEPVNDSAYIPQYYLAKLASEHVKVVLSGEGGDELFSGYFHHRIIAKLQYYEPMPLKGLFECIIKKIPVTIFNKFFDYPQKMSEEEKIRLYELLSYIREKQFSKAYVNIVSPFTYREIPVKEEEKLDINNNLKDVLSFEFKNWLPSYLLEKTDKLCMNAGIENRVPLLDYRICELAFRINTRLLRKKMILRAALQKIIPIEMTKTKKHAFYTPIDSWFNRGLKEYYEDVLTEKSTILPLKHSYIKQLIENHEKSRLSSSRKLWGLLTLRLWEKNILNRFI